MKHDPTSLTIATCVRLFAASLVACAADTGGERITFKAQAQATAPATAGAIDYDDADSGWHVSLTTARVLIGPVYLWSGAPLGDQTKPPSKLRDRGSHFTLGFLRAQLVEQTAVDLVSTAGIATPLGEGDGLTGESKSGELWLSLPADVGLHTFEVGGTATKGPAVVNFHGALTIDDTVVDESSGDTAFERRKIRAIPTGFDVSSGGTLTIGCDARRWLAGAEFSSYLPPTPTEGPVEAEIAFPDPVWGQWFYQVRQSRDAGPWSLGWIPK